MVIISAIIDQTVGASRLNCDDGFHGGSPDTAAVKTKRKLKRDKEKRGVKKIFRGPETPPLTLCEMVIVLFILAVHSCK